MQKTINSQGDSFVFVLSFNSWDCGGYLFTIVRKRERELHPEEVLYLKYLPPTPPPSPSSIALIKEITL